ncbi:MAG TPA: restriction endonuclease subunit S, partial [Planctomycetota bacterium]|nr:restriction endonuclease subunit S [Planctomycetota bacterium]
ENIKKEKKHSLPKGWEIKMLSEIAEVGAGNSAPQKKELFINGRHPFIRTSDVGQIRKGFINSSVDNLNDEGIKKLKIKKKGTILFPKSGASTFLNHRVMMEIDGYVSSHLATIKAKDSVALDRYLLYFLITIDAKDLMQDIAYPSLKISDISAIEIPVPPLPEQQRIVAILDETFSAIDKAKANAEQNLKNAKELFESYLQGVFEKKGNGWEEKKLGEVCKTGAGGTPLKTHKEYYEGGTIPWLLSGEVSQGEIFQAKNFITEKGLKNSSAKLFPPNTVLVAMYGATAGQVGILRFESTTNQAVCGILPNENFIAEFLYYKFLAGKELLVSQAVGGAQPNISQIKIKNTLVPIISIKEQQTIVRQLDALRIETQKLESIYQKKILLLEELKKSILQKAFSGELN